MPNHAAASRVQLSWLFVIFVAPLLILNGCNSQKPGPVREESYERVKIGATKAKLERLYGPGTAVTLEEAQALFGDLEAERFEDKANPPTALRWEGPDFSMTVLLADDEVVAKAQEGTPKQIAPNAGGEASSGIQQ